MLLVYYEASSQLDSQVDQLLPLCSSGETHRARAQRVQGGAARGTTKVPEVGCAPVAGCFFWGNEWKWWIPSGNW